MGQRQSEADGSMREYGLREPEFIGGEVDLSINIYRGQVESKDHNDFINANKVPDTMGKVPNSADKVPIKCRILLEKYRIVPKKCRIMSRSSRFLICIELLYFNGGCLRAGYG